MHEAFLVVIIPGGMSPLILFEAVITSQACFGFIFALS